MNEAKNPKKRPNFSFCRSVLPFLSKTSIINLDLVVVLLLLLLLLSSPPPLLLLLLPLLLLFTLPLLPLPLLPLPLLLLLLLSSPPSLSSSSSSPPSNVSTMASANGGDSACVFTAVIWACRVPALSAGDPANAAIPSTSTCLNALSATPVYRRLGCPCGLFPHVAGRRRRGRDQGSVRCHVVQHWLVPGWGPALSACPNSGHSCRIGRIHGVRQGWRHGRRLCCVRHHLHHGMAWVRLHQNRVCKCVCG